MKKTYLLFSLLLMPHISNAHYDYLGSGIQIYEAKDYSGAVLEGFMGSVVLLYGTLTLRMSDQMGHGYGSSKVGKLTGGIMCGMGFAGLGDAIRRVFTSSEVGITLTQDGMQVKGAGIVSWNDISKIECINFTTVRYGKPFTSAYTIDVQTKSSIPVSIDGSTLSESFNTVLSLMRRFYTGPLEVRKEIVQDITPRPSNGYTQDPWVNLIAAGVQIANQRTSST